MAKLNRWIMIEGFPDVGDGDTDTDNEHSDKPVFAAGVTRTPEGCSLPKIPRLGTNYDENAKIDTHRFEIWGYDDDSLNKGSLDQFSSDCILKSGTYFKKDKCNHAADLQLEIESPGSFVKFMIDSQPKPSPSQLIKRVFLYIVKKEYHAAAKADCDGCVRNLGNQMGHHSNCLLFTGLQNPKEAEYIQSALNQISDQRLLEAGQKIACAIGEKSDYVNILHALGTLRHGANVKVSDFADIDFEVDFGEVIV